MNDNVLNIYETVFERAKETYDEFIFETVEPYCNKVSQRKISKKVLKQALIEYFQNHPEEQEGRCSGMADRKKVIRGVKCCKWSNAGRYDGYEPFYENCEKCPYNNEQDSKDECHDKLMQDVLSMLIYTEN